MLPSTGPMQGVQPKANAAPSRTAPTNPPFLVFIGILKSLKKNSGRMRPIFKIPKKMITRPESLVKNPSFDASIVPIQVAEAPRRTKIAENPKMKNMELSITVRCSRFKNKPRPVSASRSLRETPDIKDIYPGTRGSTQGDKNETRPAVNATNMEMSLNMVIYKYARCTLDKIQLDGKLVSTSESVTATP